MHVLAYIFENLFLKASLRKKTLQFNLYYVHLHLKQILKRPQEVNYNFSRNNIKQHCYLLN